MRGFHIVLCFANVSTEFHMCVSVDLCLVCRKVVQGGPGLRVSQFRPLQRQGEGVHGRHHRSAKWQR